MKPWIENLVQKGIRGVITWASYSILFAKIRRTLVEMFGQAKEQADYVAGTLTPTWIERICSTARSVPAKVSQHTVPIKQQDLFKEETMSKAKKKWSFFKVVLFLGALIALAIFILDRILPKPYEDEDIDDAWANDEEGGESESGEDMAGAERPPTADIAYDVNEEDKEESGDDSSEGEEEADDGKNKKKDD